MKSILAEDASILFLLAEARDKKELLTDKTRFELISCLTDDMKKIGEYLVCKRKRLSKESKQTADAFLELVVNMRKN